MESTSFRNASPFVSATEFIVGFGFQPCLSGCHYLAHAVELYSPMHSLRDIYSSVARRFSVSSATVKRCIAYAIHNVDDLHFKLSVAFHSDIKPSEIRNGLVISLLSLLWINRR